MFKPNNPLTNPPRMTRASQITQGTFVRVYFNLHRKCFSVQAKNASGAWVVIAHVTGIHLSDVEPRVSQTGRERVKRERRKNVHALVTGYVVKAEFAPSFAESDDLTYNPYTLVGFARKSDNALWKGSQFVQMSVAPGQRGMRGIGSTFGLEGSALDPNPGSPVAPVVEDDTVKAFMPTCFESVVTVEPTAHAGAGMGVEGIL